MSHDLTTGLYPLAVFRSGSTTDPEVLTTSSNNIISPDVCVEWIPVDGDTFTANYSLVDGALAYTPITPTPQPDPVSFVAALIADSSIQPIFYLLAPYYTAILNYAIAPSAVQLLWSQLISNYGSGPLTSAIQTTIEGYATTYNMPLS